jgi:hypothetical protein
MMNTDQDEVGADQNAALHPILQSGPRGAIVLAGLATAVVVALWLAFYFLVFMPRGTAS